MAPVLKTGMRASVSGVRILLPPVFLRRDGRVVDSGRLESDYTLTGIGGSNPPPSVLFFPDKEGSNNMGSGVRPEYRTDL